MTLLDLAAGVALLGGTLLLLSLSPRFRRTSLVERLSPYTPRGFEVPTRRDLLGARSLRELGAWYARDACDRLSRALGMQESAAVKLRRIHSSVGAAEFRDRQVASMVVATVVMLPLVVIVGLPVIVASVMILATPLLVFLVLEHRLDAVGERRRDQVFRELPVVAEQLGMLLAAGYSLGAAVQRIAERGRGEVARDLQLVVSRTHQGLSDIEALTEWAELIGLDAVDRLVAVLAMERETNDVASLVADEARSIRREAHRRLIESIEKRDQQVWIPVTVSALLPGSILIAIPFVEAMRTFTNVG